MVAALCGVNLSFGMPKISDGDKVTLIATVKNTTTNDICILMATEHYPHLCIRHYENDEWIDWTESLFYYPFGAPSPKLHPGKQMSFSVSVKAPGSPISIGILATTGTSSNVFCTIWGPSVEFGTVYHLQSGYAPAFPDIAFENPSPIRFSQEPYSTADVLMFSSQRSSFSDMRVGMPYTATITTMLVEDEKTNIVMESLSSVIDREHIQGKEKLWWLEDDE